MRKSQTNSSTVGVLFVASSLCDSLASACTFDSPARFGRLCENYVSESLPPPQCTCRRPPGLLAESCKCSSVDAQGEHQVRARSLISGYHDRLTHTTHAMWVHTYHRSVVC